MPTLWQLTQYLLPVLTSPRNLQLAPHKEHLLLLAVLLSTCFLILVCFSTSRLKKKNIYTFYYRKHRLKRILSYNNCTHSFSMHCFRIYMIFITLRACLVRSFLMGYILQYDYGSKVSRHTFPLSLGICVFLNS